MCITHVFANKQLFPTSVGINTFITIMLVALTTSCDGGALLTTQGTHICLILSFILCGGQIAFISPNMRWDMVPCSIRRVRDPPSNAKLHEMQQDTHGLVQVIRAAALDVERNPNAATVQTNAQCVPHTTHAHHCTTVARP